MPNQYEIDAAARAICRTYFGDVVTHGDARCCQLGGVDGCCLPTMMPIAEAALIAAEAVRSAEPQDLGLMDRGV